MAGRQARTHSREASRADGHFCVWGGFLRDGYRQEGVRGKKPGESDRCHSRTSPPTALSPAAGDAAASQFLMIRPLDRPALKPTHMILVQNWTEELKRRVPTN
jgi:hypothetical protein